MESLSLSKLPDEKSNNKNNLICFTTEKLTYFPGENVQGKIIINNQQPLKYTNIFIKLQKIEAWRCKEKEKDKDKENTPTQIMMSIIQQKKIILDNNAVEDSLGEFTLEVGNFESNFDFDIPDNIEPSFEYHNKDKTLLNRYTLIIMIQSKAIQSRATRIIQINRKYMLSKESDLVQTSSKPIKVMAFVKKGTSSLSIKMKDAVIKMNSTITFQITVNNSECKLKAEKIKIDLVRSIDFFNMEKKLKQQLKNKLKSEYVPFVVKQQETKSLERTITLVDSDINNTPLVKLKENYPNLTDLNTLIPTFDGLLLKCGYYIKITLYFDSFVNYNDRPRVLLPIIASHQNKDDVNPWELNNTPIKLEENDLIGAKKYNIGIREHPDVNGFNVDNPFTEVNQDNLNDPFTFQNNVENGHENGHENGIENNKDNTDNNQYEDPFTGEMFNVNHNDQIFLLEGNDEVEMINTDDLFGSMNEYEDNSAFPSNPSMYANNNQVNQENNENEDLDNSEDN